MPKLCRKKAILVNALNTNDIALRMLNTDQANPFILVGYAFQNRKESE